MAELDEEKPSVEEILMLLLHQSMRNYDLLAHILQHFDKETAMKLVDRHEKMETWGPPPFIVEE